MSSLESFSHEGKGFQTVFSSEDGWSVALSNCHPGQEVRAENFGMHPNSDEVFVLLRGECHFYTAGSGETPGEIQETILEPYKVYNVPRKTWHLHIDSEDTKLLIVENTGT